MLIISQKNFFDSLSASILNLKMTSRSHWNVVLSWPRCFLLVFVLINVTFLNRFGPKELQGSLTAAILGFKFRWEVNLYIRAPLLSIIKSCINLSMWNNWSYDCPYRLPPLFLFIFNAAVSWIIEFIHVKENCNNVLVVDSKRVALGTGIAHWETIVAGHSSKTLQWVLYVHYPVAYAEDGTKLLVKSVCKTVPKSLFWSSTCVPGFEYVLWLACFKYHCPLINLVEGKFETSFW